LVPPDYGRIQSASTTERGDWKMGTEYGVVKARFVYSRQQSAMNCQFGGVSHRHLRREILLSTED
jgi:hypothetical protein